MNRILMIAGLALALGACAPKTVRPGDPLPDPAITAATEAAQIAFWCVTASTASDLLVLAALSEDLKPSEQAALQAGRDLVADVCERETLPVTLDELKRDSLAKGAEILRRELIAYLTRKAREKAEAERIKVKA